MKNEDTLSVQIHKINALCAETDGIYHQAGLKLGVPDSTLRVLYAIFDQGDGCLLADVCRLSSLSKQTVHSAIHQLEKQEMLALVPYRGHAKKVQLTPKGQEYVQKTAGILYAAERRAYADWSQEEIRQLLTLTQKYNDSLRAQVEAL